MEILRGKYKDKNNLYKWLDQLAQKFIKHIALRVKK